MYLKMTDLKNIKNWMYKEKLNKKLKDVGAPKSLEKGNREDFKIDKDFKDTSLKFDPSKYSKVDKKNSFKIDREPPKTEEGKTIIININLGESEKQKDTNTIIETIVKDDFILNEKGKDTHLSED